MTEFDLSALVREVRDTTDLTDHRQVAKEIRSRISDEDLESAFLEALYQTVRLIFSNKRGHVLPPENGRPGNKSQKRDAIREWWQRQLNQRYATAEGQKLLRYFTADDCAYQASMAREQASVLEAKAGEWDNLVGLLKLNKAQTVGDLP
jgi:hypothetical protein